MGGWLSETENLSYAKHYVQKLIFHCVLPTGERYISQFQGV